MADAAGAHPSSDYGCALGLSDLRNEISGYLRRARGLTVGPDQIIITNGTIHALHLLSSLFLNSSNQVFVENPGYQLAWQTFALTGAEIVPVPVDEDGLIVGAIPKDASRARFLYITPSHQFPTGSRLSLGRRRALIDWAHQNQILIIEDDYDGEFRYDVPQLAPLAALSNNCVIYCGTFSKTLFPDLRVGYVVANPAIITAMAKLRTMTEYAPNSIIQGALTRFIADHHFERHIQKMRKIYARKRMILSQAIEASAFPAKLTGLNSGLNAVVELKVEDSATVISRKLQAQGVNIPAVSHYAIENSVADNRLILGYADASEEQLFDGIQCLDKI
ncbi:PLP-dependent aminotransferase family protein [Parasphingorhabdus halotolerans]|uniref:PLP-dependent aminotransferase family protein n=1 Tax=Parasphingorhabdus halotolerans TaxID=2725558 RepID=A0A6H2DNF6_9SPHN|nr:PLP-dependent aminotransferase family protein [Parasphingorhabdus halotolerans]QJB69920.1 PLP-dependent aminotransferase family protein [Parasphingorhabdus halotolerans]